MTSPTTGEGVDLVVVRGGSDLLDDHVEQVCSLYRRTFSSPPFVWADEVIERYDDEVRSAIGLPSFSACLALRGNVLVGCAHGYRLPVEHGWWNGFSDPLPAALVREWPGRTFALIDFAVEEGARGRGIGRRVLDELLRSRTEQRAVLSVQPGAVRTQQIYLHWGWERVGRKGPVAGATPSFWDVFVRHSLP